MTNNLKQILAEGGLDFTMKKELLVSSDSSYNTGLYGLFNTKTQECLNVVGGEYHLMQNADIITLIDKTIDEICLPYVISKAVSINGGRRVVCYINVGDVKINGEYVNEYITVTFSNDGSTGFGVGYGIEVLSTRSHFYLEDDNKFRRTVSMGEKLKTLPTLIKTAEDSLRRLVDTLVEMGSIHIDEEDVHVMADKLLGSNHTFNYKPNMTPKGKAHLEKLYSNVLSELTAKGDTMWGLFCGVTKWTTHEIAKPVTIGGSVKRENYTEESLTGGRAFKYNKIIAAMLLPQKNNIGLAEAMR